MKMKIASTLSEVVCTILFTWIVVTIAHEDLKRFDGQKVYRVIATTQEQLDVLKTIENQTGDGVLFWRSAGGINYPIDVMVSPQEDENIRATFQEAGLYYESIIEDVQALIDNENTKTAGRSLRVDENVTLDLNSYHRLDTIHEWLDELAATYPDLVETIVIGTSYEGRLIKGIKITFDENNPGVFIDGALHAREWITPAVINYLTNEILTSTNAAFNLLIRSYNWFIFPVVNPDGYEYTHTTDRMWRKTRYPYTTDCYGADPNRNWDHGWLVNNGASSNPCDETYAGPEPFSEVEVEALRSYMESVHHQFHIYLSMHSYGNLLLLPYGYTYDHLDNYEEAMYVGSKAAEALARRYGTQYTVGSTAEAIYVASGISTDYVKAVYKTPIVYCYELRDTGTYGFLLPAEQILPTSLEFIDSLISVLGETRNLGYPEIHTAG